MVILKMPRPLIGNTTFLYVLLLVSFNLLAQAQTKTTKETKLIVIVSSDGEITALELFENDKSNRKRLLEIYPESAYFLGTLVGRYQMNGTHVVPVPESTVKVFKGHKLFSEKGFSKGEDFEKGNDIMLGEVRALILEHSKAELILKITNNEN